MNSATGASSTRDRAQLPPSDPYDALPVPVRMVVSRKQWAFCTDSQRATLVRDMTEPDWIHDDRPD